MSHASAELARAIETLPIGEVLPAIVEVLEQGTRLVVQAEPGAGKTTVVPLVLLDQPWCTGRILVLEPRRLAVRSAAERMADLLGERPGRTVGWRMRQDTQVSDVTRVEVVTEGVLTRMLQSDPALDGVSAVVFDEFHERSLDADLGLALTIDAAGALRPELRLVVMSATLDADPVADLLDATVVSCAGRTHPIELVHVDPSPYADRWKATVATVQRALAEQEGDVLTFLPGAREIGRVQRDLVVADDVDVLPLHGSLPRAEQRTAIAPSRPGRRKVVLSTSIAETSLTIEGIGAVVDAGRRRRPRLDPAVGMSRLVTLPVTRAEADQRAGRAGRLGPGVAYRLWSRAAEATMRAHPEPAITTEDLTGLVVEVAAWGADPESLTWLDEPPPAHVAAARDLLERLGVLDGRSLTPLGHEAAAWPMHPRLATMVLRAHQLGLGGLAADLAALLSEGDIVRRRDRPTDVEVRLAALRSPTDRTDRAARDRVRRDARRFRDRLGTGGTPGDGRDRDAGRVMALAYPDRIGFRRAGRRGSFHLSNGRSATVTDRDVFAEVDAVVCADLDGDRASSRIRIGAVVSVEAVRHLFPELIEVVHTVRWDPAAGDVAAVRRERFGRAVISEHPDADASGADLVTALLEGVRTRGLETLAWTRDTEQLRARLSLLHRLEPESFPDVSDDALLARLPAWLGPHLHGARRWRDVERLDLTEPLLTGLDHGARRRIDELAPTHLQVPSGHRHRLDYAGGDRPVLAVKLQELFGSTTTPTVARGRVPVLLHLLSPAGRPVQVTDDLVSFWDRTYDEVRKDLRGRYPKHPWPEDPTRAPPTARTKQRPRPDDRSR